MERLGAGDREVLTLYCFAHLSGAELAAALEIKEEEVESFIEGYLKDNV